MEEQKLHIIDGKKEYFIDVKNILFIHADHNYCDVYFVNSLNRKTIRILIGKLWKEIKTLGVPHTLVRIHKSIIVNLKHVSLYDKKKGEVVLECKNKTFSLNVAKAREKDIKEKVDIIKGNTLKFPELRREDFATEREYQGKKLVQDIMKIMERNNQLYLLAKSLNDENSDD